MNGKLWLLLLLGIALIANVQACGGGSGGGDDDGGVMKAFDSLKQSNHAGDGNEGEDEEEADNGEDDDVCAEGSTKDDAEQVREYLSNIRT